MAEVGGDLSNGGTAFEHVRGVTVAQGVGGEVVVLFAIRPHSALATLMAAQTEALFMGLGLRCMAWRRVMPELFQPRPTPGKSHSGLRWEARTCAGGARSFGSDGNFARLVVFGLGNEDDEALAVDVAGV